MNLGDRGAPAPLPRPSRERWQPLRSGLINLYRYDMQELWFEQGRLLLRGNNGTGKSRVLALQLPFLLDGEVSPSRLEPDGDPAKRVEWNLLMNKYDDRIGYTWLELGRREGDADRYLTIGCGMSAIAGRAGVTKWFFVTHQRIGEALFLLTRSREPLTRERLAEAVGSSGRVMTTAQEYRGAVDAALFKLGPHRYEALVKLLIQLRMPQLSRHLDEKSLSRALSEALPPVSPSVIDDVAEAFRSLEDDRHNLEVFTRALAAVDRFLGVYQRYLQIAARRRASAVRSTHAAYEETQRRLRAAEAERDTSAAALARANEEVRDLAEQEVGSQATVRALEESPEMRSARELERAREDAERERKQATAAEESEGAMSSRVAACARRHDDATAAAKQARDRLAGFAQEVDDRARGAEMGSQVQQALAPLGLPEVAVEDGVVAGARRTLQACVEGRHRALKALRKLGERVSAAVAAVLAARSRMDELAAQHDDALSALRAAQEAAAETRDRLWRAFTAWRGGLEELRISADGDEEALADWSERQDGPGPLSERVRAALAGALEALSRAHLALDARQGEVTRERAALAHERDRLLQGEHVPPPPPPSRDVSSRRTREGAPLWKVCDFAPGTTPIERAGFEAALESAGLLDAWLSPDGQLLPVGMHDAAVVPGTSPLPPEDVHLGRVLVPALDRTDPAVDRLSDELVASVLRHLGSRPGAGSAWVSAEGSWQLGPLHGAWSKAAAEHIGHAAREETRRRRLGEIERGIAACDAQLEALSAELQGLEARQRTARAEADRAPTEDALRAALATTVAARRAVDGIRGRLTVAEAEIGRRREEEAAARGERDRAAGDLGLAGWVERLDELGEASAQLAQAVSALWPQLDVYRSARSRAAEDGALLVEAEASLRAAHEAAEVARQRAAQAEARWRTLEETVGASVAEIQRRLVEAKARLTGLVEALRKARGEVSVLEKRATHAAVDVEHYQERLQREVAERERAIEVLSRLAARRLLRVVHGELDEETPAVWSTTRAVELARRIEAMLSQVPADDGAWDRAGNDIHARFQEFSNALQAYELFQPASSQDDNLFVASVTFRGREQAMAELRDALREEVNHRQSILDARERELLENHLIGEVAAHLHELLHEAEALVERMTEELTQRPTSTGMALKFVWEPSAEAPPDIQQVRRLLLRKGGTWSPDERRTLGAFLKQRIDAVRAERVEGTWQEHLAQALDYRAWHHFGVDKRQDGQWKRLTRRTHGTGSGGEKAIALTLPQFAAAAAHYASADPAAPRLILLDEAFVGVDNDMRGKCMGLLHAFDLDFMMTSEREWGCYATLPGVAIYQLSTRPGIDAIGVSRWVWNGRQRVRDEPPVPPSLPPEERAA